MSFFGGPGRDGGASLKLGVQHFKEELAHLNFTGQADAVEEMHGFE